MKLMLYTFLIVLGVIGCTSPRQEHAEEQVDHSKWDQLLSRHVKSGGKVNYRGFISDSAMLNAYLSELSEGAPKPGTWSREEQLAYWINAYNAFTVKLIADNYPVESIKDLNPTVAIPMVSTIWQKKFFTIGERTMSLDEIEHDILRKQFNEPRIHFAIVCASVSCPALRNEAYTAEKLEQQLQQQAITFINDPARNRLNPENAQLSKIFSWFSGDFTKEGSLIEFINMYARTEIRPDADISYLEYDWGLNE